MSDLFAFLQSVLSIYWESSIFQYIFYLSLVVIFFLSKDKQRKDVFFWYPVIALIALFNPLTVLISRMFMSGSTAYYCRLFSNTPIFFTIAYGIVLLLQKCKKWGKLVLTCFCIAGIAFVGTPIVTQSWYQKSENAEKIPEELKAICAALHEDGNQIIAAFPYGLERYVRQYDASIYMPYSREGKGGSEALFNMVSADNSDVNSLLDALRDVGCNYVIVHNNDYYLSGFAEKGMSLVATTNQYLVYNITNWPGKRYEYDENHYLASITWVGENDVPVMNSSGYAQVKREYNRDARVICESYYGADGEPVALTSGYHMITKDYNKRGNVIREAYYDIDGHYVDYRGAYCDYRREYDQNGNIKKEKYRKKDGTSFIRTQYDMEYLASLHNKKDETTNLLVLNGKTGFAWNTDVFISYLNDGSIHISGKSDKRSWWPICSLILEPGEYVFSGLSGVQNETVGLVIEKNNQRYTQDVGPEYSVSFSVDDTACFIFYVTVYPGCECDVIATPVLYKK